MKRISSAVVVLSLIVVPFIFGACGKSSGKGYSRKHFKTKHWKTYGGVGDLPQSDVPLVINDRVMAWIDFFTGVSRDRFGRYLERSGRYMDLMRETLKKNGLPKDLIYVALIESGFSNHAYSSAAAVGCWQFISSTGRHYGLKKDQWVDERRDPVKATIAAAKYLKNLYNEFGDWYLAMAAYNAGEGRIRQAIASVGSNNFWTIIDSRYSPLRAETRDYVPKYIAAAIIAKQPEKFGFHKIGYHEPLAYDTAIVDSQTDIEVVAKCAGVQENDIKLLNPELMTGTTPPVDYEIKLPPGTKDKFKVALAKIPPNERILSISYAVGKHDNLQKIARRFGVSPSAIVSANNLKEGKKLHRGQILTIPRSGASVDVASNDNRETSGKTERSENNDKKNKGDSGVVQYQVRKDDNLDKIAERYNVSVAQLKRWNGIKSGEKVRKGQIVKIYKDKGEAIASLSDRAEPTKKEKRTSVSEVINKTMANDKTEVAPVVGSADQTEAKSVASSLDKIGLETELTQDNANTDISKQTGPSTTKTVHEPVLKETKNNKKDAHLIKSGETLSAIAKKYNIEVDDLKRWNNLGASGKIVVGKKLVVTPPPLVKGPKEAKTLSTTSDRLGMTAPTRSQTQTVNDKTKNVTPQKNSATAKTYKVKAGDTVWEIAKNNNVSEKKILELNNLKGGVLKPGTVLKLSER